jgi:hypothetical protein
MNIKLALLAALLLATRQAMAEDVRVDCMTDQRIVCRDDETTCLRVPERALRALATTYRFTFDLAKKTGSLVFCSDGCLEPSPLTVVYDYCTFLHDYGAACLIVGIFVWEPVQRQTYSISNSRYIMTHGGAGTGHSFSITEFGHCAVQ